VSIQVGGDARSAAGYSRSAKSLVRACSPIAVSSSDGLRIFQPKHPWLAPGFVSRSKGPPPANCLARRFLVLAPRGL